MKETGKKKAEIKRPMIARASVAAVYATCKKCGEALYDSDTGSEMLVPVHMKDNPERMVCHNCGQANRLPAWVTK